MVIFSVLYKRQQYISKIKDQSKFYNQDSDDNLDKKKSGYKQWWSISLDKFQAMVHPDKIVTITW